MAIGMSWRESGPCVCNEKEGVVHEHYLDRTNQPCARCGCQVWRPSIKPVTNVLHQIDQAEGVVRAAKAKLEAAQAGLVRIFGALDYPAALEQADEAIVKFTIYEQNLARKGLV